MKNGLKIVIALTVLFSSSVAMAQQPGQMQQRTPEEKAQRGIKWMEKNLALSQDQDKRVYDILLRAAQQAYDTKMNTAGREKKQEMQGIKSDEDAQLKAVLTGEQYQRYMAHVQEMKERRRERRDAMPQG